MANSIELAKSYVPLLDKVYKLASKTSVLDSSNEYVRAGANANEILVPKMSMSGLAPYSKSSGYAQGDVTLEWETLKCDYDRGRKFNVDAMDNIESAGIAFGQLAGEFIRTKVVPELDAYRFTKYFTECASPVTGSYTSGKAALTALRAGRNAIENAEADLTTCYLFITPALKGAIDDVDTTTSRKAMEDFAGVITVPATRFLADATLGDDGFTGKRGINFCIIDKQAVQQYEKHVAPKIFTPDQNTNADGWIYTYRIVSQANVFDNKKAGVYFDVQAAS